MKIRLFINFVIAYTPVIFEPINVRKDMEGLSNITTQLDDGVLLVSINRPESLNALNIKTMEEIRIVVQHICDTPEIKAAIFTGSGEKAFVAGADIKEITELNELNARKFAENGQETFAMIEDCEKPILAAVNGFALGGGCELAMACHIRVASANAKFGLPEVSLGIIPGYGGTQRLTKLIGKGRAFEMILTGDMVSAQKANEFGLVNHVVETQDELITLAKNILKKIITKGPLAIGMAIHCVNAADTENGYQTEANSFSNCCKTDDFKEGTTAFIEKRKAQFTGN